MNASNDIRLKGIIVPLVTPLSPSGIPDMKSLHGLLDHVIEKQVDGIFILGTTGEGSDLSDAHRQQIIRETCRHVNRRTVVLVGIMSTPLPQALTLASTAADAGADGVVLAAPFNSISQKELFEYTQTFAQRCLLPVCLYNRPNQPEIVFKIDLLKKLLESENIISVKDSSGDKKYFKELLALKKDRPDVSILTGFEELLAGAVSQGADGGVTGGANLFPDLYVALYRAVIQQNTSEVQRLQRMVEAIVESIYQPDYLSGLKYALSCKKLCTPVLIDPQRTAGAEQKERIELFLEKFDENCF